jgi:TPR repeat protein
MYTLGILMVSHPEIGEKGSGEAVSWLERAAEAGTWQSSAALGAMARDGRGMRQDEGEAFRWFTIAAKQGGTTAEENTRANLEACRATLPATEQDEELRTAESWLAEHPHADLFLFNDMHSSFPVGEVYAAKAGGLE